MSCLAKYGVGSSPLFGRPVILEINLASTRYGWSSHRNPLWKQNSNYLMYVLSCTLWPNSGMNNMFVISTQASPSIQSIGLSTWASLVAEWSATMHFVICNPSYCQLSKSWNFNLANSGRISFSKGMSIGICDATRVVSAFFGRALSFALVLLGRM